MQIAVEVQDRVRPRRTPSTPSDASRTRSRQIGETALWLGGLLVLVSLSLADGIAADVVAYERDTTVFYFPLMSWLGQQLQHGSFPLWTPQFFGGYPLFADGEIGLAYPPVLLALLNLPADRAFVLLRLVHVWIAAIGMFGLARAWRLPYPSAVLAGIVFTLGSFLQAQIHHENIVRTASWLTAILACVELSLRSTRWRPRLRWMTLATLCLGLAGLSLHSQMLAIDLLVLAAYGAYRWAGGPLGWAPAGRRWLGRLLGVAAVCLPIVLVGFGLAAVQLLPLVELAGFSARGSGIPYSESAAYSLTPMGLVQVIFPYVFRNVGNAQWGLWTHWESYLYVGLAPLVLAIIALVCVRRREVAGWGLIGGLGLILSLGQYSPLNLHYVLWLLPGLSGLRAPGRFTVAVVLAAAMLSAHGLAWLISQPARTSATLRRLLVGLTLASLCLAAGVVAIHAALAIYPDGALQLIRGVYLVLPRDSYPLSDKDVLSGIAWSTDLANAHVSGALVGLAVVLGTLWAWRRRATNMWPTLLVAITAVDLLLFDWAIHPREPLAKIAAEPAAVAALEQLPTLDAAPNRVMASPALNQVAPDRIAPFGSVQEAGGYSSLQFIWHRDYLSRVLYDDDELLDLWNVRYILDPARFGKLSSYKGVDFLPQQALVHAPAGGRLAEQRFALNPRARIVELRFVSALMDAVNISQGTTVARIELRDASDTLVGAAELQAGRDAMDWAAALSNVQAGLQHQLVESAGQTNESTGPQPRVRQLSYTSFILDGPVNADHLVVRAVLPEGEFVLFGGAVIDDTGAAQQLFGKTKAKYREVYADNEIRILEDTAAFSRAFVVPRARVAPSLGSALNQMVHQPFQPDQEVILADDTTTPATGLSGERGGTGTARVTNYAANGVQVHTSASGDAWLVLSDTYYPGWTAAVDGQPTSVLRGDVLFRVVPIPAGEHDVEFRFEPTSVKLGLLISLLSVVAVGLVWPGLVISGRSGAPKRTT